MADDNCYSVYFVGAKDEILQKAIINIKEKFPNIVVRGQH
ncbi:MAG: glycosyltransferase, partial [Ezakiella coagulans]